MHEDVKIAAENIGMCLKARFYAWDREKFQKMSYLARFTDVVEPLILIQTQVLSFLRQTIGCTWNCKRLLDRF
uniref:Uncharacterized protein n=1 Tax=Tetranychus urticae TaxID=32264 RepID=T1JUB7_TETUR